MTLLDAAIKKRISALEAVRSPWEDYWKECMEFALPSRSTWNEEAEEGKRPAMVLYNTKAVALLRLAADGFIGYMAPRSIPFFHLGVSNPKISDRYGVADWLEEIERIAYQELARSRFYEALSEMVPDALCVGTGSMCIYDDVKRGTTRFQSYHPMEVFLGSDGYGQIDQLCRKTTMTVRQISQYFPKENLPDDIRRRIENDQLEDRVKIAHLIYPREGVEQTTLARRTQKPWASFYYDLDHNAILDEGGFDEFPVIVWPYSRNSQETYGRSPTMDALTSIKMGNQIDRTRLELAQKVVDPPLNIPQDMKGEVDLTPRGYNFMPNGQKIEPINLGGNYPMAIDVTARNDEMIGDHYHADFFTLLAQARSQNRNMTATEVMELQGEKSAVLSTLIGNFESSVLDRSITRTLSILARRGSLPPPPEAVVSEGAALKIEYVGPLAQAQKKYHQAQGVYQGLDLLDRIAPLFPDSLMRVDPDALIKEALGGAGMPASAIREDEDVAKMQQAQIQMQQQQQQMALQMEQQKNMLGNLDKLNQQKVPGSMLDQAEKQMQQAKP